MPDSPKSDATIIPFPQRDPAVAGEARLSQALGALDAALEEQRRALSDWRFAMTELGIGVAALSHSLAGYKDSLGLVETKLGGLHEQSARLAAWADGVVAPP